VLLAILMTILTIRLLNRRMSLMILAGLLA
jgi:hypothetical protein